MKKITISIIALFACACVFTSTASAYWIWTPETKKFINPKTAPKDSPKEQFDWAMSFYNTKDYKRAATEFEKVTKHYEYSEYASKAQYYVGLSYENMEKFYTAFENYQKAIDNFPHIENMDEIIAREFNIGKIYATKDNPKVMGTDIMAPLDRAIDIFKKVVENAPYGKFADEAQVNMADAMKRSERFDEAAAAFQKILDDYPTSKFTERARFEVADCAYRASLKPDYDSTGTDKAIKAFQDFTQVNRDSDLSKNADKTVQRLRDNMAQKSMSTADFYEKQGQYRAAMIYYQDVITTYPDSSFLNKARAKLEEMKVKLAQPKTSVLDMFKKKDKVKTIRPQEETSGTAVEKKKAGWSFFGLGKAKPKEAVTEAQAPAQKKAGWNFFGLGKPKPVAEPKEGISETAPQKKGWSFFGFGKSKQKETVTEAPKAKQWTPLNFEKPAKPEPAVVAEEKPVAPVAEEAPQVETVTPSAEPVTQPVAAPVEVAEPQVAAVEAAPQSIQETPKKKGWSPLNFDKPSKPKEITAEPKEGISEAAPQKKGWSFFGFGKSKQKETVTEAPKAKQWTPLNFEKPAKQEQAVVAEEKPQPVVVEEKEEAPQAETVAQTVAESPVEPVSEPIMEPVSLPIAEPVSVPMTQLASAPIAQPYSAPVPAAVIETTPQKIQAAPEKKGWTWAPLNFTKSAKPEEGQPEKQRSKKWKPLNFSKDTKFQWQGFR